MSPKAKTNSVKVVEKQIIQSTDKKLLDETIETIDDDSYGNTFGNDGSEEFLDEEFSFNNELDIHESTENVGNEDPLLNKTHKKSKAKLSKTKSFKEEKSKTLFCKHCAEQFSTKSNLIRHISSQHSEERKMYQCELCDVQLTTHAGLKTHIRCRHINLREYKCEYCGKGFNQKKTLAFHLIRHTNERPYVCEKCGNGFPNPKSLNVSKLYEL